MLSGTIGKFDRRISSIHNRSLPGKIRHWNSVERSLPGKIRHWNSVEISRVGVPSASATVGLELLRNVSHCKINHLSVKAAADEIVGELSEEEDDDDDYCPVECVREFKTDEEFMKIMEKAKKTKALVIVDFYRTSCGSCKYIEKGFSKICKGSGKEGASIIFLKHNVIDEYDEQSEVADRLRIKTVPLFHFYRDGVLLESFATRDKERIDAAINRYTSPVSQES